MTPVRCHGRPIRQPARPGNLRSDRGGEKKANRDNPTFKNRRNSLTTKKKTFSNRDKNTYSALPHFRPRPALPTLRDHELRITSHKSRILPPGLETDANA